MNKEELKEYLKDNLDVQVKTWADEFGGNTVLVKILLEGEVIAEDRY